MVKDFSHRVRLSRVGSGFVYHNLSINESKIREDWMGKFQSGYLKIVGIDNGSFLLSLWKWQSKLKTGDMK
jgi:hypothetical protein